MSSAAVLAIYAAGYCRTRLAADRLTAQYTRRRPALAAVPQPSLAAPDSREGPAAQPLGRLRNEESSRGLSKKPTGTAGAASPVLPEPIVAPSLTAQVSDAASLAAEPNIEAVPAPETAVPAPATSEKPAWKDGTYLGWGHCVHGTLQASIVVKGGLIASATIAQCYTRYPCSVISMLPPQVAERQSAEVDRVSSATESADAFYFAVVDALEKAR